MGMFDTYYLSREIKCPCCGTVVPKTRGFQSKELECCMSSYGLGDVIDGSRRFIDWYHYCDGQYRRSEYDKPKDKDGNYPVIEPICDKGYLWCRVYIDDKGIAWKEVVTMSDGDKEILIYEKSMYDNQKKGV